jgi:hypothetical protein
MDKQLRLIKNWEREQEEKQLSMSSYVTFIYDDERIKVEKILDFSKAFVEFNGRIIRKTEYPNVFDALTTIPISRFDFRIVPIQGVKETT